MVNRWKLMAAIAVLSFVTGAAASAQQVEGEGPIHGLLGKCVDVFGATPTDGTPVVLFRCTGKDNQRWTIDYAPGSLGAGGNQIVGLGGNGLPGGHDQRRIHLDRDRYGHRSRVVLLPSRPGLRAAGSRHAGLALRALNGPGFGISLAAGSCRAALECLPTCVGESMGLRAPGAWMSVGRGRRPIGCDAGSGGNVTDTHQVGVRRAVDHQLRQAAQGAVQVGGQHP